MKDIFMIILKNKQLLLGSIIVSFVIFVAVFAPFISPHHPVDDANLLYSLEPPGGEFLLGTDAQGRCLLSRLIYGARVSLIIGFLSQGLNTVIGVVLGMTAGFIGGRVDDLVMNFTNIVLSLPPLILALTILALIGPSMWSIFLALGVTLWTYTCRVARAQTLSLKEKEFVEAAQALGMSRVKIAIHHILPNILGPILVIATFGVGSAILLEASLSFLGIGTQPPTPSWGTIISRGRDYIYNAPWLMIYPGIAIFITVLGVNLLGDGLRDFWDPRRY